MRFLVLLLLWPLALIAAEPSLPLSNDVYAVSWRDFELGDGTVTLERSGAGDCYRYQSQTDPAGIVRMFYGAPSELSEFCIVGGRVRSSRFEFSGNGDDDYRLDFDWKRRRVRGGDLPERVLPADGMDHFAIQQAVRLWLLRAQGAPKNDLKLTLVEKNGQTPYRFQYKGRERIEVPAGRFDCLRVELTGVENKQIRYWVSPENAWALVRLEHRKRGKQQLLLELKQLGS